MLKASGDTNRNFNSIIERSHWNFKDYRFKECA
jgi:hypothetical protein